MTTRGPSGRRSPALLLLALILASSTACATRGGPLIDPDQLAADETMPLFWRAEGERGATLFLLGSVHLGPPGGWIFPKAIEQAFEASSAVVVEIDPADVDEGAQRVLLARYGMLPPGVRLQDRLSAETWDALQRQIEQSELPVDVVDHMQPWLVANLLVLDATRRMGMSLHGGVDTAFIDRAGERSIVALETAEYQMKTFATLPPSVQELMLEDTLGRFDDFGDYLAELVELWRVGDENGLEAFVFDQRGTDPDFDSFYEALFFRRNREMAKRLRVLLDADQHRGEVVFVTVGAGHLLGPEGIPALLSRWGYGVVRLDRHDLERGDLVEGSLAIHP